LTADWLNTRFTNEASGTIFSGAGTGTCEIDLEIAELTELQVGSYALVDAGYMANSIVTTSSAVTRCWISGRSICAAEANKRAVSLLKLRVQK